MARTAPRKQPSNDQRWKSRAMAENEDTTLRFYDEFADDYHLAYGGRL
jgi:hypothetical protein